MNSGTADFGIEETAFAISERLGIDRELIDRANEFVSTENIRFENVVDSLEESRLSMEKEKSDAEKIRLEYEEKLNENNMPAKCFMEIQFKMNLNFKDKKCKSLSLIGINTTTDMYEYFEGTAPQYINEVALTDMTAEKLGADALLVW